jgi:rhodanese-related sulfurtransferase
MPSDNPAMTLRQPTSTCLTKRRRWLAAAAAGAIGLLIWPGLAQAAVDPATVPEPKRTKAGRYLMAADVPAFIQAQGGAGKVLFLDLRTRAEAMYVGMATGIDALVPFVEHQELMTDWDAQRGMYRLEPLQDFVPEVNRRLAQKGLAKTDTVVLICRSGDRSSRGANRLADDGYTQVWSVVDGFEGDMGKDGRRSVNGWKNTRLPWSYKLDRDRMYFPR